jgi:hypothetical protein
MDRITYFVVIALMSLIFIGCGETTSQKNIPVEWRSQTRTKEPQQWGMRYTTPGVLISFRESIRTKIGSSTQLDYLLFGNGAHTDKRFNLWLKSLKYPKPIQPVPSEFHIDAMGKIVDSSGREARITVGDFKRGEWVEVGLIATDSTVKAFTKIVPFPIEAKDKSCRVWAELVDPDGKIFTVSGEGFPANAELSTASRSEGEAMSETVKTGDAGDFFIILLPSVIGKQSGTVTYTASGKTCTVTLSFNWGRAALIVQ